jgi:amidase
MTADSDNNIFGRVLNPHKLSLGAGGSSGGEGALIAMRGSILRVGTDIAGSIRIPAFCDGTLGFKPSVHRILFVGMINPTRSGWVGIDPVAGPLAQSPRDLRLFLETVINAKPWDYDCSASPFPGTPSLPSVPLPSASSTNAPLGPSIHPSSAR